MINASQKHLAYSIAVDSVQLILEAIDEGLNPVKAELMLYGIMVAVELLEGEHSGPATRYVIGCISAVPKSKEQGGVN